MILTHVWICTPVGRVRPQMRVGVCVCVWGCVRARVLRPFCATGPAGRVGLRWRANGWSPSCLLRRHLVINTIKKCVHVVNQHVHNRTHTLRLRFSMCVKKQRLFLFYPNVQSLLLELLVEQRSPMRVSTCLPETQMFGFSGLAKQILIVFALLPNTAICLQSRTTH